MRYSKSFTILSLIWLQAHRIALVVFNLLTLTIEGADFCRMLSSVLDIFSGIAQVIVRDWDGTRVKG